MNKVQTWWSTPIQTFYSYLWDTIGITNNNVLNAQTIPNIIISHLNS